MPYGIPKEHGGDSPTNVAKMESCVRQVLESNGHLDESHAVAICKSSLFKAKEK